MPMQDVRGLQHPGHFQTPLAATECEIAAHAAEDKLRATRVLIDALLPDGF